MSEEIQYQHRRTKKVANIIVYSQKDQDKICRWIEIQLNKHGWYKDE